MLRSFALILLVGALAGCGGSVRQPEATVETAPIPAGYAYGLDASGRGVAFGFEGSTLVVSTDGGSPVRMPLLTSATSLTPRFADGGYCVADYPGGALAVRLSDRVVTRLDGTAPLLFSGATLVGRTGDGRYAVSDLASGTLASFPAPRDFAPLALRGGNLLYRHGGAVRVRNIATNADAPVTLPERATAIGADFAMDEQGDVLGSAVLADGTHLFVAIGATVELGPLVSDDVQPTALANGAIAASYTAHSVGYVMQWGEAARALELGGANASTGLQPANGSLTRGLATLRGVPTAFRLQRP